MPVRIYDISKKLGLENKEVLSKAKQLGLVAARVASSSLDKITAEYLEQQLILEHPHLAAPPAAPPSVATLAGVLVAPPPPTATVPAQPTATATAVVEAKALPEVSNPQEPPEPAPILIAPPPTPEPAAPPAPPPPPPGPKVGDKIGFIQLPPKAGP